MLLVPLKALFLPSVCRHLFPRTKLTFTGVVVLSVYMVRWVFFSYRIGRCRPPETHAFTSQSTTCRLLEGGGFYSKFRVVDLGVSQLVAGDFECLFEDHCLTVRQLSSARLR